MIGRGLAQHDTRVSFTHEPDVQQYYELLPVLSGGYAFLNIRDKSLMIKYNMGGMNACVCLF